jgi:hypothetical protein
MVMIDIRDIDLPYSTEKRKVNSDIKQLTKNVTGFRQTNIFSRYLFISKDCAYHFVLYTLLKTFTPRKFYKIYYT